MEFTNCGTMRIPTNEEGKFIEVEIFYSLGGLNVFTYVQEQRGYYARICPITVERNCVSFVAFSGRKILLHECARKSAKAEREAVNVANSRLDFISQMIREIARKNNLEVAI